MTYRSLLLSYFNIDTTSYQGVLLSTAIVEPSHVVALTHSTIQDGCTALGRASIEGHHKVVELLLGAGANPDLQDKVRIEQGSGVHVNLSNGRWYVLHPVKPGTIVNLPPRLYPDSAPCCTKQTLVPLARPFIFCSVCFQLKISTVICIVKWKHIPQAYF